MQELPETEAFNYFDLAANIVSAYVSKNSIRPTDLAELIASVHQALGALGKPTGLSVEEVERPTPAQIKKSITPDALISFVDGRSYKMLKRHLNGHGLTPNSYRERFGLPRDYPMVAADYAARRSALAKSIGLGRLNLQTLEAASFEGAASAQRKDRGRPRKPPETAGPDPKWACRKLGCGPQNGLCRPVFTLCS